MKKIILILLMLIIGNISYSFDVEDSLPDINKLSVSEQKEYINTIKSIIFAKNYDAKLDSKEFKKIVNEHKKDKNYTENYYAAQGGYKYFKGNYIKSFITSKMDIMYMYSLQERNNMRLIYYYSILGNLKYVEILYENYPNSPYYSRKYNKSGNLISTTYRVNEENEIIFNNDGSQYEIVNHK